MVMHKKRRLISHRNPNSYIAKDIRKYFCVQTVRWRKYTFKNVECKINETALFYKAATCFGLKLSRHQTWEERHKNVKVYFNEGCRDISIITFSLIILYRITYSKNCPKYMSILDELKFVTDTSDLPLFTFFSPSSRILKRYLWTTFLFKFMFF
jgi:hypothetical protein